MQQLFKAIDGAMIRVSADDPRDPDAAPWPGGTCDHPAAWHGFIAKAWASAAVASAVELASPSLATTVREILSGGFPDRKKAERAGMALARYLIRLRGRATPFGLFAGVAPAPAGIPAAAAWDGDRLLGIRADARWLASLVAALEADGQLRRRLLVTASDLLTIRGDRIIVDWLPQASALAQHQPAEVSLRRTPAAEAALRLARTPVMVGELAGRIADEFGPATVEQAGEMIGQLIACGALVSSLRPPSTAPDGLRWVLGAISAADGGGQPDCARDAALREVHQRLSGATPGELGNVAARMRELADAPSYPVAVDLRAGCRVTIAPRVAHEAAAAATALARLSPHPHGSSGWNDYRARFLDRYGLGAAVPVTGLLDPVTGLGLPAHYTAPPPAGRRARDERLAALAQQAALDGTAEVVIDDALIAEITGEELGVARPVPHMDITVGIRAASPEAISDGAFTIAVCGVGRTAMAATGRFLHLLTAAEHERLAGLYSGLPVVTRGALAAQLSFPPRHPRTENVTRVPRMLLYLLSLGEHHSHDDPARIPLADLAVTASADRFCLISLSQRVPVEPVLACAPAWHAVPPVARLLFELPRAHCPPVAVFDWGAAASLPFLPRVRAGRAVLAPARWRIPTGALPGPRASQEEWGSALARMRDRLRLPAWVSAGSGDRQLRLNLDEPMDLAVLRAHLDTCDGPAVLAESWSPEDHAWCGGRAHEFTVPLTATAAPAPPPKLLARAGPLPVADRDNGQLPGTGGVLSARLYSDPALFDEILTGHLPALTGGWDELALWWFIRYRDPRHHLRIRLHAGDYGQAAARVGEWAAELRRQGLVGDLVLDTYRPETGRFGSGPALAAAETFFAADSAAAAAQLVAATAVDPRALTAASLTAASLADLAAGLLGGPQAGMRWLRDHPAPADRKPLDRDARLQALALTGSIDAVPAGVRHAWRARASAAGAYAELLAGTGRDPAGVLEALLHLHHNRVHGPGRETEALTYRLARACALRPTETNGRTPPPCTPPR